MTMCKVIGKSSFMFIQPINYVCDKFAWFIIHMSSTFSAYGEHLATIYIKLLKFFE